MHIVDADQRLDKPFSFKIYSFSRIGLNLPAVGMILARDAAARRRIACQLLLMPEISSDQIQKPVAFRIKKGIYAERLRIGIPVPAAIEFLAGRRISAIHAETYIMSGVSPNFPVIPDFGSVNVYFAVRTVLISEFKFLSQSLNP